MVPAAHFAYCVACTAVTLIGRNFGEASALMVVEVHSDGSSVLPPPDEGTAVAPAHPAGRGGPSRAPGRIVPLLFKAAVPLVVLGGAVTVYQYMLTTKPPVVRKPVAEKVFFVDTVTARKSAVTPQLVLYGTIVARRQVDLRPLVSGRVVRVAETFADGGIVRKDDLLVEIDSFDYRIAVTEGKARLAEARARLTEIEADLKGEKALIEQERAQTVLRRRDLVRRQSLLDRGAGTEKLLDDAKLALNSQQQRLDERVRRAAILEARLAQQQAVIARAEWALTRAERNLRDTRLLAPFDGFLGDISTGIGKKVGGNDKIARLTDAGSFEAEFQVSDAQYGRLVREGGVIGRPVSVVWRTGGQSFAFPAAIARVSDLVSSTSGGVNLFARLRATDTSTLLRPGLFVEIEMVDTTYRDVYRLPDDALHEDRFVYVVDGGQRLVRREVTVAGRVGNDILMRGPVADGERIVARIFPEIGHGLKVDVPTGSVQNHR